MISAESSLEGSLLSVSNDRVRRQAPGFPKVMWHLHRICHVALLGGFGGFQTKSKLPPEKRFGGCGGCGGCGTAASASAPEPGPGGGASGAAVSGPSPTPAS
eukprot:9401688-Lingulodinium_polyedra.AAC.1